MTKMKEAALAYAKRGWPVFPIDPNPNRQDGKAPYEGTNGVIDATCDPKKIKKLWDKHPNANIGLNAGEAGLMILDLDPGHDMEELETNIGPLPKTLLNANTPRGGVHLYFALDPGEYIPPSQSKLADHVDVRSFHSYVLLPPSRSVDGTYTWRGGGSEKPAYRTDRMAEQALAGSRQRSDDHDTWIIDPDIDKNVEDAIRWLTTEARVAVEGRGGDGEAVATAAMMKSYGISEPLALEIMWEHWNPKCIPPWDSDEFDHFEKKVANGYAYNTSAPGNVTDAYKKAKKAELFKPVEKKLDQGRELTAGRFRIVDRRGMDSIRPPSWLIPDFLPENSYSIMFGAYGTFKTFLALDVGLSIAQGVSTPWHGPQRVWPIIPSQGSVLFAAGEGRSQLSTRVAAWEHQHTGGELVEDFALMDPVPSMSEEPDAFLDLALELRPEGYKLVIIDTIGRAMQGVNENAQENASAFTKLVQTIQYEFGCAVLCLHHTGHGEEKRARGSSVFGADADMMVRLDRNGKDQAVKMVMTKQKDAEEWEHGKTIMLDNVTVEDKGVEAGTLVARRSKKDEIAKATKSADNSKIKETMALDVVDRMIVTILEENKHKWLTQSELANMVAQREGIKMSASSLASRHFRTLRDDSSTQANKMCDLKRPQGSGQWRYVEPV